VQCGALIPQTGWQLSHLRRKLRFSSQALSSIFNRKRQRRPVVPSSEQFDWI
jgi:hypothetical protein